LLYRPTTTIPGIVIVLLGVPVYFLFRSGASSAQTGTQTRLDN